MARWDRIARIYDLQLALERPALAAAAALLAPAEGERVLDVATGTAGFLRALAGQPVRARRVLGLDASAAMLGRAPCLPVGWELRVGDARSLPLPNGSIDAAACCYLLHLLDEDERTLVLSELVRVLRPGGRLVAVTPAIPRARLGPSYASLVSRLGDVLPAVFAGLRPLDPAAAPRRAGLMPVRGAYVARGYPSLAVLSARP